VKTLRLIDVVAQLPELGDALFICVRRPWGHDAETVLVPYPEDLGIPAAVKDAGFNYFLEVATAREILSEFQARSPSLEQSTDFVIYYAENDAFPAWAEQF
jgi:hypothetical protein